MELLIVYIQFTIKTLTITVRVFYFCTMLDYIIVGGGIAGLCFAEILMQNNKSFIVISDDSQNSSHVAAGLYNPIILKRFSLPQDAERHLTYMKPFYKIIEDRLAVKFDYDLPVYRRFVSVEEQNDWFIAADKLQLSTFLSTSLKPNIYTCLHAPYGFGKVLGTGYIDTNIFIAEYQKELQTKNNISYESFDYSQVFVNDEDVTYKSINAKHIVFAEGFGIKQNPFFNYLPLDGTKGEILIIHAPELKLDVSVNSGVFILPSGNDIYKIGATYEWEDKTALPTEKGRAELIEKLNEIILCDYTVIDHVAGIRPTVKDRKALIGTHHKYNNVHLLNGLGTRGVMLGPSMAKELYDSIENGHVIAREINLSRFNKLIQPDTDRSQA